MKINLNCNECLSKNSCYNRPDVDDFSKELLILPCVKTLKAMGMNVKTYVDVTKKFVSITQLEG